MKAPTLRAAVYARKSNREDKHEDNKSVTRQVAHAKAYAKRKGWTIKDEHVYVDDDVSGALFRRPGLLRMLNALKEFDLIVMSEHSRLGREQTQLSKVLVDIYTKGKKIFFYLTDEELRFSSAVDKFMVSAVSFASELEREKAAQRIRDSLQRKAERGWHTGGRCFGYDNVWCLRDGTRVVAPPGKKRAAEVDHVELKINDGDADIVRAMFAMRRDGHGFRTIAVALNGAPEAKANNAKYFKGRAVRTPRNGTWSTVSVLRLLGNPRYTGKVPWGRHHNELDVAESRKTRRILEQFLMVPAPHLRIVDEGLWNQVQTTLRPAHSRPRKEEPAGAEGGNKRMSGGRRGWFAPSAYLLSGMGNCSECGSAIVVSGVGRIYGKERHRYKAYRCSFNANRGSTACKNNHRELIESVNRRVVAAIESKLLKPELDGIMQRAMQVLLAEKKLRPDRRDHLKREIAVKQKALQRYVASFGESETAPAELVAEIERRRLEIVELEAELKDTEESVPMPTKLELRRIKTVIKKCGRQIRRKLRGNVPAARQALRELLTVPLTFRPVQRDGRPALAFEGQMTVGPLLDPICMREKSVIRSKWWSRASTRCRCSTTSASASRTACAPCCARTRTSS